MKGFAGAFPIGVDHGLRHSYDNGRPQQITTGGTILVALAAHFLSISRGRQRNSYTNHLAIWVVTLLNPFITGCNEIVSDSDTPDEEKLRTPDAILPTLILP